MPRILIADDQVPFVEGLKLLLDESIYDVETAHNGEEALAKYRAAKTQRTAFDLVILDCLMPKKQGMDVAKEIRADDQKLPIVLMSGILKSQNHIQNAKDTLDIKNYLSKPFQGTDFLQMVAAILNPKLEIQQQESATVSRVSAPQRRAATAYKAFPEKGSFEEISLLTLLLRAERESLTGVLDVLGTIRARIFIVQGECSLAQLRSEEHETAENIGINLVRLGKISEGEYLKFLETSTQQRKGLFEVIKKHGELEEKVILKAYEIVSENILERLCCVKGHFLWHRNAKFKELIPQVHVDMLKFHLKGLRDADEKNLEAYLKKKEKFVPALLDFEDEETLERYSVKHYCASDSLLKRINGRVNVLQILASSPNKAERASRAKQLFYILSLQDELLRKQELDLAADVLPVHARSVSPKNINAVDVAPEQGVFGVEKSSTPVVNAQVANPKDPPKSSSGKLQSKCDCEEWIKVVEKDMLTHADSSTQQAKQKILLKLKEIDGLNYYQLFSLDQKAESSEIKKSYLLLARDFHNDAFSGFELGETQRALTSLFSMIQNAYVTLKDAVKREEYDIILKIEDSGSTTDLNALFAAEDNFTKAKMFLNQGKNSDAIALLERCIKVNSDNPEWNIYIKYAKWWLHQDKSKASQLINEIQALAKEYAALYELQYFSGRLAQEIEEDKKAARYYSAALAINQHHSPSQTALRVLNQKKASKKSGGVFSRLFGK